MSDGILSGLDPQAIAKHFGEDAARDMEYTLDEKKFGIPCAEIVSCNGEVIAKLERERDTHSGEVARLRAELDSETKWAKQYHDQWQAAEKRIAELERDVKLQSGKVSVLNGIMDKMVSQIVAEVESAPHALPGQPYLIDEFIAQRKVLQSQRDAARQSRARLVALARYYAQAIAVTFEKTQKEVDATQADARELAKALIEARDCVQVWGSYASAYSQDKHDLAGDIERAHIAIQKYGEKYLDGAK